MEENFPELNSSSPRFSRKQILSAVVLVILLISIPIGVYLVQHTQIFKPKAVGPSGGGPMDFYGKQITVLKMFGQKDYTQAARNSLSGNGIYHGAGTIVDKSSQPNKVFLADTGNNRILGFNGLGYCQLKPTPTPTPEPSPTPTPIPSPSPTPILPELRQWLVSKTSLPEPGGQFVLVDNQSYYYVIGGMYKQSVYYNYVSTDDFSTPWLQTNGLPKPLSQHAATLFGNFIYVSGGTSSAPSSVKDSQRTINPAGGGAGPPQPVYLARIKTEDGPTKGQLEYWQDIGLLPQAKFNHGMVAYNNYLYVLGGDDYGYYLDSVYYAKIDSQGFLGSWQPAAALPKKINDFAVVAYQGYIYVIGGYSGQAEGTVYSSKINSDGSLGSWVAQKPLPQRIYDHSVVLYKNYLYVIGGRNKDYGYQNTVYTASLNEGTIDFWATNTPLPVSLASHQSSVYDKTMLVFGGVQGGKNQTAVYRTEILDQPYSSPMGRAKPKRTILGGDSGNPCTVDSDCESGQTCLIDGSKGADIVLGQPDLSSGACNLDNNLGIYINPTANSLCLTPFPYAANLAESWGRLNIEVDSEGNVWVPDNWNNRILKYNQPFSLDKTSGKGDNIADFVLGQDDFVSGMPNYSRFQKSSIPKSSMPSNKSLWIDKGPTVDSTNRGGVSVDQSGNVWVADTFNHRVLRFPKGLQSADLVLGQAEFTTRGMDDKCYNSSYPNPKDVPLDKLCLPTLAKIDPETGKLYVLDEYNGPWVARILIYNPPFISGMVASDAIAPTVGPLLSEAQGKYVFEASGFTFNPYKQGDYANGKIWVNEHKSFRTSLLDDNGNIVKVINAPDSTTIGGHDYYSWTAGTCNPNPGQAYSVYTGFHMGWPGGSIGVDQDNNLYFADETSNRLARFALPYNTKTVGSTVCLPEPNGGTFTDAAPNMRAKQGLGESFGMAVFQNSSSNQLIVKDEADSGHRLKVWDDYLSKQFSDTPDLVIEAKLPPYNHLSQAIDEEGRLWLYNSNPNPGEGMIKVYQLPFRGNDTPLQDNIKLYWTDTGEQITNFGGRGGIAFDKINKKLYIVDSPNHRIFKILDYRVLFDSDPTNDKLLVEMVIGQPDKDHTMCNHDQPPAWVAPGPPAADSLCGPTQIKFDNLGNLYVVENSYEGHGNIRITVFMADDLKAVAALFPNIKAKKVFIASTFTEQASYQSGWSDKPFSPVTIAFNSKNQLVISNDGTYHADPARRHLKQLWFYSDPLNKQLPDGSIDLPMGVPAEMTFDKDDNLFIHDGTWGRVWMINPSQDSAWGWTTPSIPTVNPNLSKTEG